MNEEQQRERRVHEVIAQGRALVRDARLMVERTRRRFAELGIDPESEYERLKAEGGELAVVKVQAEFQNLIEGIESEIRRDAMHAQANGLVRLRARSNRV